uniref:Uncharacterized protein n=1 Tax=Pyrodinium bahamense TaxID=73915 RepID=A0A7S0ABE0_9DINO
MSSSFRSSLGLNAARRFFASSWQVAAPRPVARPFALTLSAERTSPSLVRPFSALGAAPWCQIAALHHNCGPSAPPLQRHQPQQTSVQPPPTSSMQMGAATAPSSCCTMAIVEDEAVGADTSLTQARSNSMVFEIGLTFTFLHYQSIFIFFARGLFQAVRPLLILFVFGQILKAVFFVAGAPIWCSFYSIWMFEVIYGLAQCAISFIFICSFYNNLSFNRLRPTLGYILRQEKEKFGRAARAVSML